jgi:translation initiation factor 1
LCVCDDVIQDEVEFDINVEERTHQKEVTVITVDDSKGVNLSELGSTLKKKLACGGTSYDNTIELQGNHTRDVKRILEDEGYIVS